LILSSANGGEHLKEYSLGILSKDVSNTIIY